MELYIYWVADGWMCMLQTISTTVNIMGNHISNPSEREWQRDRLLGERIVVENCSIARPQIDA